MTKKIGMIGLGPMGKNLALNMISHDIDVMGYARSEASRQQAKEAGVPIASSLKELADFFDGQKIFWIMVPSSGVDGAIESLLPYLSKNDVIIEGGNTHFKDTDRRARWANQHGVIFIGTGVSGGEEGALKGPSIMPGGDLEAYHAVEEILKSIAAKVGNEPCVAYIGPNGAGHFVKIVHNGIEYAIMQGIGEVYHILLNGLGLSVGEIQKLFAKWAGSDHLGSYLTGISADILNTIDKKTGKPLVEMIKDTAGQKGTGRWTSQVAYDIGVPVHNISAALLARIISAYKLEREEAEPLLSSAKKNFSGNKNSFLKNVEDALYSAVIISYAQGFALLSAGSTDFNYELKLNEIAKIWRNGCIIRSNLLRHIYDAFTKNPGLKNLMLTPRFSRDLKKSTKGLRKVVSVSVKLGVPVGVLSQSLAYYDSYRTARLPSAALIQAQRDYFGAHTYERIDEQGIFHTLWSSDRSEVRQEKH